MKKTLSVCVLCSSLVQREAFGEKYHLLILVSFGVCVAAVADFRMCEFKVIVPSNFEFLLL